MVGTARAAPAGTARAPRPLDAATGRAARLEFGFGGNETGPCGYVANVVSPQITGDTAIGATVTTWPGQWNACSSPLVAVDVYWPSDGSHGTAHVVTAADVAAGQVCSQSTVWDADGETGGPLTACLGLSPIPPPPPATCTIAETARPAIAGDAAVGSALAVDGGSWQPSCGGGLRAADILWSPDGSHAPSYVVRSSDRGTSVCATVTVWDEHGASAGDGACVAIPAEPPPPPPPPPPPADTTPPVVALTAPADGAVLYEAADVTAEASDDAAVAGVQFLLDGNPLGAEDRTAPYRVRWDISTSTAGAHTLTAVARDAAGNRTTAAAIAVTTSDSVTDGVGVFEYVTGRTIDLSTLCVATDGGSCAGGGWCHGRNQAWGTAAAPSITYKNRLTGLVYWKAHVSFDVCLDTAAHEIVSFAHAAVTPLYMLPFAWSYDNAPHWSYGPTGPGTRTSWVQVNDGFTGCLYRLPIGCNHVTFSALFRVSGLGLYSYVVRFL